MPSACHKQKKTAKGNDENKKPKQQQEQEQQQQQQQQTYDGQDVSRLNARVLDGQTHLKRRVRNRRMSSVSRTEMRFSSLFAFPALSQPTSSTPSPSWQLTWRFSLGL